MATLPNLESCSDAWLKNPDLFWLSVSPSASACWKLDTPALKKYHIADIRLNAKFPDQYLPGPHLTGISFRHKVILRLTSVAGENYRPKQVVRTTDH